MRICTVEILHGGAKSRAEDGREVMGDAESIVRGDGSEENCSCPELAGVKSKC